MPIDLSFKNMFHTLENSIGLAKQRHELIAGNLSNMETPDYVGKDFDFQAALENAMEHKDEVSLSTTSAGHMGPRRSFHHAAEPKEEKEEWNGYNWINIERTMNKLIENSLTYRAATDSMMRKITLLREVIRDGGP